MDNIFSNNFYSNRCCQNFSVKGQINILGIGGHCGVHCVLLFFCFKQPCRNVKLIPSWETLQKL